MKATNRKQVTATQSRNALAPYTGFIFPYMAPDEVDRFINWASDKGYNIHKINNSSDSFKKTLYNQYAKRYNKKTV
jgi:hypothetical protein